MKRISLCTIIVLALTAISAAELLKDTADQKIAIYTWDGLNGIPATGIGASLEVQISKDGGEFAALADTEAAETGYGWYVYDLAQAESNCNMFQVVGYHTSDPNYVCTPVYAYPKSATLTATAATKLNQVFDTDWATAYDDTNKMFHANVSLAGGEPLADVNDVVAKLGTTSGTYADFDPASHSLQAIRTQGDSAWITATGFSTLTEDSHIGIDWSDIANPTSTVALTNTTVGTATAVTNTVDADIESVNEVAVSDIDDFKATGFSTHTAANVWSVGTRTLTALDEDSTTIDINAAVGVALSDIYLDHFMANALTDPNNIADNSVLAKLVSATAAWTTFSSASHSLEAIADSIIPPPPSPDLTFTVVATSTASMVTIQVGDVAIPANFWKDCLVRVDHTDWSAGSYSRVAYSTAQSGGKVILYLSSTLPFTPAALTDKVYIEAWGLRPADLPPRGPITY